MILFSLWKMRLVGSHHGVTSSTSSMTILMFPSVFGILIKPRQPKFERIGLGLDNNDAWINLIAFQAYMNTLHGSFDEYRTRNSTPFSSRAPSRATSSVSSRAPSRVHSPFSLVDSRPSSRASFIPSSCAPSSRSSSPFDHEVIVIDDSDDENDFPAMLPAPLAVPKSEESFASLPPIPPKVPSLNTRSQGSKRKQKAASGIELTREETVDEIVEISTIPSTWPVPRIPTAYLVDLSRSHEFLKDQNSWGGSNGHFAGDADTAGFFPGLTKTVRARRCHWTCNGVHTCEFIDPSLFAGCQRYEPDEAATRALWKHELDANEREAAQPEIDDWHNFCASQEHADIKNWYAHKCANPWILPSVNKILSRIPDDNWDITPNHSNIVETAHAGRNAKTSIGVGLLTAILESQERDNTKAANLLQIERDGVMHREKLSTLRKVCRMCQSSIRKDQLTSFEALQVERDAGAKDNTASLVWHGRRSFNRTSNYCIALTSKNSAPPSTRDDHVIVSKLFGPRPPGYSHLYHLGNDTSIPSAPWASTINRNYYDQGHQAARAT
ncbi:hypothetical protein B0H17DRAFT_1137130 [Mycena rosella]|uniref:Uncharacterized protein n=1 Tax=Mycena rosella TaxID=1033263 RepID=A0AAD7GDR4_MYCRO|nr:hypothetical protein B0H17DRAFT_1137130 [Mycena rosella]